jgi:hypothetical protein
MAFLTQNKAKLCKILIITLVFEKNANFFAENRQKSQKIVIITSTPGHTVTVCLRPVVRASVYPCAHRRAILMFKMFKAANLENISETICLIRFKPALRRRVLASPDVSVLCSKTRQPSTKKLL